MHFNNDTRLRFFTFLLLALCPISTVAAPGQQSGGANIAPVNQVLPSEVRKLEVGKATERELKSGESHTYEITLPAGQYLEGVVEQKGVDVVVIVIAPDGKKVMERNSPLGRKGPEPILFISEAAGIYHLQVKSREEKAPSGRYEIKINNVRVATENDRAKLHDVLEAGRLFDQSKQLRSVRKYDDAIPLAERALSLLEKALGPQNLDVAEALNHLALLYESKGDYAKAEPLFKRAIAIKEQALGAEHLAVAISLNDLAMVYRAKGELAKAEPLLQHSLAIHERELGEDHPFVANALHSLALLYDDAGNYAKAESLYQRSLEIKERVLGVDNPSVAITMNNLAGIYRVKGNTDKAEALFRRALAINEKAFGPEHPEVASSLNNLAGIYIKKKEYANAEPLLQRSLAIKEKSLGADHPSVGIAYNNLGEFYRAQGDYGKAEPLYQRAIAIKEKALGADNPSVAFSMTNLAGISIKKGDYAKAETLYQRVLEIYEKSFGPGHAAVSESLSALAEVYEAKGEYAKAVDLRSRANAISEQNIDVNLTSGSERDKLLYLTTLSQETDCALSLNLRLLPNDPAALRLALTTLLRRKGRALDAMAESLATLRKHLSPEQQALLDKLTSARAQLASLTLKGPGKKTLQEHQAEVKTLEEQVEKLEDQISRQSAEFRAQSQPVTIEAVQSLIPLDAALVEFVSYRPFDSKVNKFEARHYAAYVLTSRGQPLAIDLGDADRIDKDIYALRAALLRKADGSLSDIKNEVKPRARALDQEIMQPVRSMIGGQEKLLIAPDGVLNLLPFAALVDEKGKYLIKRYSISYLTSGRDLLRLQVKTPSKRAAAIIADPDFDTTAGVLQTAGADTRIAQRVNADEGKKPLGPKIGEVEFQPLQRLLSTVDEAREVQKSLPDATVLTGATATKAAVKSLSGPTILHIATHGFFLDDQKVSPEARLLLREDDKGGSQPAILPNPLLRSGLLFAGANTRSGDGGILTALESSGLDLYGTKLVVLSACDTGLGDIKTGEGVYGLRRALVLAGSESQVISLWSVSDKGTSELMIDYYKRLKDGESRGEALRNAQLRMLRHEKRKHPYYWAAFIQSGEWANLDGTR